MKKLMAGILAGVLAGGVVTWVAIRPSGRLGAPSEESAEAKPEAAKPEEAKPAENPLHLTPAKRASAGIVTAIPRSVTLAPEIDAFGRVLDPTPYVALVAEEAAAKASLEASEKELERVQKLFASGGNASAQAVETAEAAAVRDRAAVASAHIRLLAGWGVNLANHATLAELEHTLERGAALIRIDLLPGLKPASDLKSGRVSILGAGEIYEVEILGPAPVADPQVQGASYLALLRDHSLPAGASLRVALPGAGEAKNVLVVPQSAVVYQQGNPWVYTLGKNDTFSRELVSLGRVLGDDVVIAKGIDADDQVATTGAQQLLSAELSSGGAPDED